ncbi:MAG: lysine--tRNA ligase [Deltaproteobacteria bacterium]|nr:lysine--tRNA ligase [Deltaproteobacteria bacterium]
MSQNQPWPLREATSLLAHIEALESKGLRTKDDPVLFETGYGPSGLPHIGTFAEVARTTFIRRAFRSLTDRPTRLIAFSDDMDGLRKVPLNIPNPETVEPHLGKPLSSIPDPFGVDDSYSGHMNRRLREFLDQFGFEYDFRSSTDMYTSGVFNESLSLLLGKVDDVLGIILPTLRPNSREGWSPFMPVCPDCGRNLSTSVTGYHSERDALSFACDGGREGKVAHCGASGELSVLDGNVKVGWKVDWALRWFTFGIHYEMYGKDLIESAQLSARIVRALGGVPPVGLFYEMFLDEDGKKISKSIGKGISVDGWQEYAPVESLSAFLYQNPRKAKRLTWDTIPNFTDQYLKQLADWETQDDEGRLWNPSYFYFDQGAARPSWKVAVNYSLVRNLVVCMGKDDPDVVTGYLQRYDARVTDDEHGALTRQLVRGAIAYDRDFEAGSRTKEAPASELRPAILELADKLEKAEADGQRDTDALQSLAFDSARANDIEPRTLFQALYRGLIGQNRGPRFGGFMLALGLSEAAAALRALAKS